MTLFRKSYSPPKGRIPLGLVLLLFLSLAACSTQSAVQVEVQSTSTPTPLPEPTPTPEWAREGWELVWQDEFEGDEIDLQNWTFDLGAGGWGNNESQFYTDRPENARVENGMLVIEARREEYRASDYTSARLKTQHLHAWRYGRIEARMKLPTGQGIWSAFWMLGEDIVSVGWPRSGEIDIMENIGESQTVYGTVHGPGYSGGNGIGSPFTMSGAPLHETFHTYAIEWEPGEIRWYVDDALFNVVTDEVVPGAWVYDHPFFIILNVAVGGVWPGYPDETTQFPQQLLVDYVRVYRDPDLRVEDLQSGVLHVGEITMALEEENGKWEGTAYVTVVDQNGNPVEDVLVVPGWLGVVTGATEKLKTNDDGVAGPFVGTKTSGAKEISFCITDLSKSQYTYDKTENAQTCVFESP